MMARKLPKYNILKKIPLVPIGCNCSLAHNMRANNILQPNTGFEWVRSPDLHAFSKILDTNFKSVFDLNHCYYDPAEGIVKDAFLDLDSLHDFSNHANFKKEHQKIKELYLLRLSRFKAILTQGGPIVLLRYSSCINNDTKIMVTIKNKIKKLYPQASIFYFLIYNKDLEKVMVPVENIQIPYKTTLTHKIKRYIREVFQPGHRALHEWKGDYRSWRSVFKRIEYILSLELNKNESSS